MPTPREERRDAYLQSMREKGFSPEFLASLESLNELLKGIDVAPGAHVWYVENGEHGKHFGPLTAEELRRHAQDGIVKKHSRLYCDDGEQARFIYGRATSDIFVSDASGPIETGSWHKCPTGEFATRRSEELARSEEALAPNSEARIALAALFPNKAEPPQKDSAKPADSSTVLIWVVLVAVVAGGIFVCSGVLNTRDRRPDSRSPYERDRDAMQYDDPRQWGTPY